MRNIKHNKKLDMVINVVCGIAFVVMCYVISEAIFAELGI